MSWFDSNKSPFAGDSRLIFHGTYHKMGTVWMMRVLQRVADMYGLKMQKCNHVGDKLEPGTGLVFANHSQLDPGELGDFVGSHLIRDPRDVIVSGYFYHLWTDEAWAHEPWPEYEGRSYQQILNSVDQHAGIAAEIDRFAKYVDDYSMRQWNYADPRIIELRYEDLIADEPAVFERLFRHYGFHDKAVRKCVKAAQEFSFERVTARKQGQASEKQHLRSGQPGQWRDVLSTEHCESIRVLFGDLLVMTGYELELNW
ncbi:MAG: sulfotransferase domain-containing protein [Planctomycetota bacterium]